MASSRMSAYEEERKKRLERNAEAMKLLLGVDVHATEEAKQSKMKEKRAVQPRGSLSVATPSMRASARLKQRKTPRISYREQDDDDEDDDADSDDDDEEVYTSGQEEEDDEEEDDEDDDDENSESEEEDRIVKRKKAHRGSKVKSKRDDDEAHIEIDENDEDEDAQLARAIRLSMEAHTSEPATMTIHPSSSKQASTDRNAQVVVGVKEKQQQRRARAEERTSGGGGEATKRKRKTQKHRARQDDVENEDAIEAAYANAGADIPDGPLIELFGLLAGSADRTIGRRELLIAVQRHASLLNDPTQFTEDTINNMIVVANACRGGGGSSSSSSGGDANDTINLKAFAAFVRQKLPRIFSGR